MDCGTASSRGLKICCRAVLAPPGATAIAATGCLWLAPCPDEAERGHGADRFVESLKVRAIKPVIPPKSNRKVKRDCDFALYAERNLVERFFNTIKHFRAIATRYEKTARNFLAGQESARRAGQSRAAFTAGAGR